MVRVEEIILKHYSKQFDFGIHSHGLGLYTCSFENTNTLVELNHNDFRATGDSVWFFDKILDGIIATLDKMSEGDKVWMQFSDVMTRRGYEIDYLPYLDRYTFIKHGERNEAMYSDRKWVPLLGSVEFQAIILVVNGKLRDIV